MKYLILVGDGMGDRPCPELNGRTPLAAANTPNMDRLAREGILGLAQTIPAGMEPGSDVANLSLMGYDPAGHHIGRGPLEAAAMGLAVKPDEIAFRCNLVFLAHGDGHVIMEDYCAGHIESDQAAELIAALNASLGQDGLRFYPGVSYRHILLWRHGPLKAATVPPHDRTGQGVHDILGQKGGMEEVNKLIRRSWPVLKEHPINLTRRQNKKPPANSIWLWGQGVRPELPTLPTRFGLRGLVVSAVDLIRGIGILAGLIPVEVAGATGYLDTNYAGKVRAVLDGLKDNDIAFLHVEAPDEASHEGSLELKIKAIEDFDQKVVGELLKGLGGLDRLRILLATDHFTPLEVRTHTTEPVPFAIWDSGQKVPGGQGFNEAAAGRAAGRTMVCGHNLIEMLIKK